MTSILSAIFFLSGASALVYEALWFRLAGITFGNSVWASSIVLAGFMGGLALGNGLVAYRGDRIKTPIRFYAVIEIIIAISGLTLVFLFPHFTRLFAPLFRPFLDHPFILNALRAILSIGLLLLPATAMGATLPLLVKALYREKPEFSRVLGLLYGFNTLGAVVGVLSVEPIWVNYFGVSGAGIVAASVNILTALSAYTLSRKIKESATDSRIAQPLIVRPLSSTSRNILIAGFFSGFLLLALEVIWFRFLLLFFSSSSWIFAIMLAVILLGISLGGIIAAYVFRNSKRYTSFLFLLFIFNGILVITLYGNFNRFINILAILKSIVDYYHVLIALAAIFLMLPVSLISGILFTVLGSVLHEEMHLEAGASGLLILCNTLGGMIGALMGGALCLPLLGVELSFFLMGLLYGLAAFITVGRIALKQKTLTIPHFTGLGIVFLIFLAIFPFGLMQNHYLNLPILRFLKSGYSRVALKEGLNETIQYIEKDLLDKPYSYILITNNHAMSGVDVRSKRYMRMFAYWPVAVLEAPQNALLICFGCGSTAKALTNTKSLKKIDIVDISKDVIEMSKVVFPDNNHNPIYDPRVKVHIEDGRFFLQTTDIHYDIITAEPPPPKHNGIVNLYTQEYFQLIYDQLKPGGIVTYWLPVYQLKPSESKSILKGFANVFTNCSLWSGAGLEWMMVGIKPPLKQIASTLFERQWQDPLIGPEIRNVGLLSPEMLNALFIADGQRLAEWIAGDLPLTDNYPQRLSFHQLRRNVESQYFQFREPEACHDSFMQSEQMKSIWPAAYHEPSPALFQLETEVDKIFQTDVSLNNLKKIKQLHEFMHNPNRSDLLGFVLNGYNYNGRFIADCLQDKGIHEENYLEWFQTFNQQILTDENSRPQLKNVKTLADHFAFKAIQAKDFLLAEKYYRIAWNTMTRLSEGRYQGDNLILLRLYLLGLGSKKAEAVALGQNYIDHGQQGRAKRIKIIQAYWDWHAETIQTTSPG